MKCSIGSDARIALQQRRPGAIERQVAGHQEGIISTGLEPSDGRETAIFVALSAGAYTTVVHGKDETIGIGLVEAYILRKTSAVRGTNLTLRPGHPMQRGEQSKRS